MIDPVVDRVEERALATINVRIPLSLKEGGEAVLEREGVSVSEAIRKFYMFLERNQVLPDFFRETGAVSTEEALAKKRETLKSLVGAAPSSRTLEQIKDDRLSRQLRSGVS